MSMETDMLATLAKQHFKKFIKSESIKIEHYDVEKKEAIAAFKIPDLHGKIFMANKYFTDFVKKFDLDKIYESQGGKV